MRATRLDASDPDYAINSKSSTRIPRKRGLESLLSPPLNYFENFAEDKRSRKGKTPSRVKQLTVPLSTKFALS
jgi:hypothetical protein